MDIILDQAERITIHALSVEAGKTSATITIGQGLPGKCHIEIVCGEQRRDIAINGDKLTIAT